MIFSFLFFFCFEARCKFCTVFEDIFIQRVKRNRQDQSDQCLIFRQVSLNPFLVSKGGAIIYNKNFGLKLVKSSFLESDFSYE